MDIKNISRRQFLKSTGLSATGVILGTYLPAALHPVLADETDSSNQLNLFVSIQSNGIVDIVCHRSEMGQGIRTGIAQVIAEELCVNWQDVNVVQGLANQEYGSQNTDGSRSIRNNYSRMRDMGATARSLLEHAAAKRWGVETSAVITHNSTVQLKGTSKQFSFGELATDAASIKLPANHQLTFKSPSQFTLIGKPVPIVDMDKILKGTTVYGQDVIIPDMLIASIERSPVIGATVLSFDNKGAESVSGVVKVIKMPEQPHPVVFHSKSGVAVLASNTWSALQGRKQLNIKWSSSANSQHDSKTYGDELKARVAGRGKVIREVGNAYQKHEMATTILNADYSMPYLTHAPMEAPAATAHFKDGKCEIWACTQTPQSTQRSVAGALGIDLNDVKVNVTLLGGGFGRKSKPDFSVEAAILAKQMGRPVKVVWSREDDIQHSYYHAISRQHFSASFDDKNQFTSWIQRTAFPSISWTFNGTQDEPSNGELSQGFGDIPFELTDMSCESHKATAHTRIGWIRSVANNQHGFAIGSFVDEVSNQLGQSTYQTWMQFIGSDRMVDPKKQGFDYANYGESYDKFPIETQRLKNVLSFVFEKSNADQQTAENEGWGISVHRSFTSYVAVATKVRVIDNKLEVLEMHSGIDAGLVVNPDRVHAQLEGALVFGLSIALVGEIEFADGAVKQSNFHDYSVARINQVPKIMKTYIVPSQAVPGGVGEPGVPPVAPSITNAIFHASGQRIRDLPIRKVLRV